MADQITPLKSCPSNALKLFMALILNLFVEKQPPPPYIKNEYDFIIVGGGAAGCVLANRLSEVSSWDILLLEAGVEQPRVTKIPAFVRYIYDVPELDWNFKTVPQPQSCEGKPCSYSRAKMLGGCTSHNYMTYVRGNKKCFDKWSESGNDGWAFQEVLPYFKKSEDNLDPDISSDSKHHSFGGELSVGRFPYHDKNVDIVRNVLDSMEIPLVDFNGHTQNGYTIEQKTSKYGIRMSTNTAFLKPIRKVRKNLHVVTDAFVTKILISAKNKDTYGVKFILGGANTFIVRASREVILCAGVINSPRLLQLSGIGPEELLDSLQIPIVKSLQGVGDNFQDHVVLSEGIDLKLKTVSKLPHNLYDLYKEFNKYLEHHNGPFSGTSIPLLYWFSKVNKKYSIPDIVFLFSFRYKNNKTESPCYNFENITLPSNIYNSITIFPFLMLPKSRGSVKITSPDPFSPPEIQTNFLSDSRDFDAFTDALRFGIKIAQSKVFAKHGAVLDSTPISRCSHLEFGSNHYLRCVVWGSSISAYHGVGTCKMGPPEDETAVVNPNLLVYGVSGLRIIDASIMPEIVNGYVSAAVIMIAEKGADLVKEIWLNTSYSE